MNLTDALRRGLEEIDVKIPEAATPILEEEHPTEIDHGGTTGTFWAAVFREPDGTEYAHLDTIAYHEHGARAATDVIYRKRPEEWRERNQLIGIRRFRFGEEPEDA